jgi:hypothetical protein
LSVRLSIPSAAFDRFLFTLPSSINW